RALLPAAFAAGAAVADLGYGGIAWVAPAGLVVAVVLAWRAWRAGAIAGLRPLVPAAALALVLVLPTVLRTVSFFNVSSGTITGAIGNLVGAVPFREAFNVWLAHDYRLPPMDAAGLSPFGVWLAGALCVIGGAWALWRRNLAIPLALLSGLAAVVIVTPRYRFDELAQIADRTRGQGPVLVNDFEQWAPYILRGSRPWIEHTFRAPYSDFNHPGRRPPVRPLDPDDYQLRHIEMFPFVV